MYEKLTRTREERADGDRGFTLIELLVVVVIIGVLIAIAIPLYLNYRKGAENKSAASDLRGSIATLEQCFGDNSNAYPATVSAGGVVTGCGATTAINVSSGTALTYLLATGGAAYIIYSTHTTNGVFYCYSSVAGGSIKTEPSSVTATTVAAAVYTAACP
jgi:type IV pilus assembly protein PilA